MEICSNETFQKNLFHEILEPYGLGTIRVYNTTLTLLNYFLFFLPFNPRSCFLTNRYTVFVGE